MLKNIMFDYPLIYMAINNNVIFVIDIYINLLILKWVPTTCLLRRFNVILVEVSSELLISGK